MPGTRQTLSAWWLRWQWLKVVGSVLFRECPDWLAHPLHPSVPCRTHAMSLAPVGCCGSKGESHASLQHPLLVRCGQGDITMQVEHDVAEITTQVEHNIAEITMHVEHEVAEMWTRWPVPQASFPSRSNFKSAEHTSLWCDPLHTYPSSKHQESQSGALLLPPVWVGRPGSPWVRLKNTLSPSTLNVWKRR